jgi:hypothetical protein
MASYRKTINPQIRQSQSRSGPNPIVAGAGLGRGRPPAQLDPRYSAVTGIAGSNISQRQQSANGSTALNTSTRPSSSAAYEDSSRARSPMQTVPAETYLLSSNDQIVIHVCDENRKVNRDFKCSKTLLLSQMKYFEKYLVGSTTIEDIDISVHCDVEIFEWLMKYLQESEQPELNVSNVISILISSDFLQMEGLVDKCIDFVRQNLEKVCKLAIDMSCLNSKLLKKLANLTSAEELNQVKDPKDRLIGKLFLKKLEAIFEDESSSLVRCVYCDRLFTSEQKQYMVCEKAQIFIDFHGNVIAEHVPDRNWEMNKFILFLKSQSFTWRELYWKLWGRLVAFTCTNCGQMFSGAEYRHCSYHPLPAKFAFGSNIGCYECCNQQAVRFDTSIKKKGCTAREHTVSYEQQQTSEFEMLMANLEIVQEPFNPAPGDRPSFLKLVQMFTANEEDAGGEEDESDGDADITDESDEAESDDEEEKSGVVKSHKKKLTRSKSGQGRKYDMNPKKQRVWKLDALRLQDFEAMRAMVSTLTKARKTQEAKAKPAKAPVAPKRRLGKI